MSNPRTVPGGSPQGSILGNFLFCVATRELGEITGPGEESPQWEGGDEMLNEELDQQQEVSNTVSFDQNGVSGSDVSTDRSNDMSPISRPSAPMTLLSDSSNSSDSFDFRFFTKRTPILEDTELSVRWDQHNIDEHVGVPEGWVDRQLAVKVYIGDLNNIEKIKQSTAVSVISESKTRLLPHAVKSEENFERIRKRAGEIGMRVNAAKTQMLCISGNPSFNVQSYIRTGNEEIRSTEELKILGFWFGTRPNVSVHVEKLLKKFRSRLWALRHLKKSGMNTSDLLFVFTTVLRPILDFAAPTYHPLLSVGQSNDIEKLQKKALRVVYGPEIKYEEALAVANITSLQERRETLTMNFAVSTEKNPRYQDGWFPKKPNQAYPIRKPRPYMETKPSTERMKKNPINYMRKMLNDAYVS